MFIFAILSLHLFVSLASSVPSLSLLSNYEILYHYIIPLILDLPCFLLPIISKFLTPLPMLPLFLHLIYLNHHNLLLRILLFNWSSDVLIHYLVTSILTLSFLLSPFYFFEPVLPMFQLHATLLFSRLFNLPFILQSTFLSHNMLLIFIKFNHPLFYLFYTIYTILFKHILIVKLTYNFYNINILL